MNKLQDVRIAVLGLGSVGLPLAVDLQDSLADISRIKQNLAYASLLTSKPDWK